MTSNLQGKSNWFIIIQSTKDAYACFLFFYDRFEPFISLLAFTFCLLASTCSLLVTVKGLLALCLYLLAL